MNSRTLILLVMAIAIAALMVVMVKNRTASIAVASGPKILVATADIPAGTFIRSDKNLGWAEWPQANISPAFIMEEGHKIEDFNGGVSRRDIVSGEPITAASIVKASDGGFMSAVLVPGKRAVSIAVNSTSGNAGFIFPGDHVDLLLTHRMPGDVLASETFIEDVRVLAIDQMLNNPENKAVIAKTITLEVTPKQAEMINVAISIGSISVSLRSLVSDKAAIDKTVSLPANDNGTPASQPAGSQATEGNYSTNADVSRLMNDKGVPTNKVSVYHGSSAEQLNFQEGRK